MRAHEMIALIINAAGGQVEGRMVMQKLGYFATIKVPSIEDVSYRHYFYGPFSAEVAIALDEMAAFSYLDEVSRSALYDRYKYILTDSGREYAKSASDAHPDESREIKNIVDTCKNACQLKGKPLSLAAKVYYIRANGEDGPACTPEDVGRVASSCYGWNLSKNDTARGIEVLEKLEFANRS